MAPNPIVFALANPEPEVQPEAIEGLAAVIATGRSDYPNQINNVLCFPGFFRGLLDSGAAQITDGMKLAAARAIAGVVGDDLNPEYIIPSVFNRDVAPAVAAAVIERGEDQRTGSRVLGSHRPAPRGRHEPRARALKPTRAVLHTSRAGRWVGSGVGMSGFPQPVVESARWPVRMPLPMRDARLPAMDVDQHIDRIRADGEALAEAAAAGPLDVPVPGCPGWDVEALLRHIGDVHRWAAMIVRERLAERPQRDFEGPAGREELLAWYRDGCAALIDTLQARRPRRTRSGSGDLHRTRSPSGLAARRTRLPSTGATPSPRAVRSQPLTVVDALDALDEWFGLAVRRARAPEGGGRILRLGRHGHGHHLEPDHR